jgi:hypothetical protein
MSNVPNWEMVFLLLRDEWAAFTNTLGTFEKLNFPSRNGKRSQFVSIDSIYLFITYARN